MKALDVYLKGNLVGRLEESSDGLVFAYGESYVQDGQAEPLSYVLPLRTAPYVGPEVETYFSNLLPDDYVRTRIGEILQIPRENTYALLEAIGGDCAGAVALYPKGQTPASDRQEHRPLEDAEAVRILSDLEKRPLNIGDEGFRISGAGAQDKLVACVRDGHVWLPLHGTPSTHIIKPDIRNYPGSVLNEWFCMRLAAECRHEVAACDVLTLCGERYYVTTRYDRVMEEGGVRRLHQEDFCQLLKVDPRHKYEAQGGPGLSQCLSLLRALELSAAETVAFLERVVFNFLVGNGDAHGKNFSVLYQGRHCRLAPLYDVMATTVYPDVGKRMAMKVDGEYAFRWMTTGKFLRMAAHCGISEKLMLSVLRQQRTRITRAAPRLAERLARYHSSSVYGQIVEGIVQRGEQLDL